MDSVIATNATGTLRVLDRTGDSRVTWDRNNADEVAAARRHFERLRKKGYAAFRTERGGSRGAQIREFDPDAEEIILAPALVGG